MCSETVQRENLSTVTIYRTMTYSVFNSIIMYCVIDYCLQMKDHEVNYCKSAVFMWRSGKYYTSWNVGVTLGLPLFIAIGFPYMVHIIIMVVFIVPYIIS